MNPTSPDDASVGIAFLSQARDRLEAACGLIRHCTDQLDDEQVWRRTREAQNSIGNLLLHITGNLRDRIVGVVAQRPNERDRPGEFSERGPIAKDVLVGRLEMVASECDAVLSSLAAGQLLEPRSYQGINRRMDLDVLSVIFQTVVHLAGHAQEIVFMTRSELGDTYRFANVPRESK
jgi:Protein of unknown function (DUF1572)